jgi:hypothetical protein
LALSGLHLADNRPWLSEEQPREWAFGLASSPKRRLWWKADAGGNILTRRIVGLEKAEQD